MWFNGIGWLVVMTVLAVGQCRSTFENDGSQLLLNGDATELELADDFAGPSNHAKVARDLVHQAS